MLDKPTPAYEFTNDWHARVIPVWDTVLRTVRPRSVLELGCYEGQSTAHLIERCAEFGAFEIVCVDTWEGGGDLSPELMTGVEDRFDANTKIALGKVDSPASFRKLKMRSTDAMDSMPRLGFDFISIDAAHTAEAVLTDGVMAFRLLRIGGYMIFDDYVWCRQPAGKQDLLDMPKTGIDAFVNCFMRKINWSVIGRQMMIEKVAE